MTFEVIDGSISGISTTDVIYSMPIGFCLLALGKE